MATLPLNSPNKSLQRIDEPSIHSLKELDVTFGSVSAPNPKYVSSTGSDSITTVDARPVLPTSSDYETTGSVIEAAKASPMLGTLIVGSPHAPESSVSLPEMLIVQGSPSISDSDEPYGDDLVKSIKPSHFSLPALQGAWKVPLTISHGNSDQANASTKLSPQTVDRNSSFEEQNHRFPWAAKMKPSTRNLHRVTSPTYMDDGTPKVQIPSHVLLKGLENQREFVIGQFYRCTTPSPGLVHAMVNRLWGKRCKIFIRKLGESSFMFHIPDESTRSWVIHRGLWHIDNCLMFVAAWSPAATLAIPEISTIPMWVTLKNIPTQLYSMQGISYIASGLGAPMSTNKPRLDPTLMGEAKILVEVELNKPFPQKIAAEDTKGNLFMIGVEYSWLPPKCGRCDQLGHKESRCLLKPPITDCKAKTSPLPIPQMSDSCLNVLHQGSPIASVIVPHDKTKVAVEAAPSDDLLVEKTTTKVVSLPVVETISIVEVAPHNMSSAEVHETIIDVAEATHTLENTTTTGNNFATHSTKAPPITTHSSPQLLSTLVVDPCDCVVEHDTREDVTTVEYDNDNFELASLESCANDINLMTPSTQRILRERPLKPYHKFQEGEWISAHAFRGKRSRGRRGRQFD